MTSPTVQLEAFILSLFINIFEGRDVATAAIAATADVTGAFLLSKMKDFVIV